MSKSETDKKHLSNKENLKNTKFLTKMTLSTALFIVLLKEIYL